MIYCLLKGDDSLFTKGDDSLFIKGRWFIVCSREIFFSFSQKADNLNEICTEMMNKWDINCYEVNDYSVMGDNSLFGFDAI